MTDQTMTITIRRPDSALITDRAETVLKFIEAFTIDSAELHQEAGEELRKIATMRREMDEERKTLVDPLNKEVKAVNDLFRTPIGYLERAETMLKQKIANWVRAEQERLERERAEREAQMRAEQERLQKEAAAAAAEGDAEAASAIEAAAAVAVAVPVKAQKVNGVSTAIDWTAEITDLRAFLRSIADDEHLDLTTIIDVRKSGLNALAKQYKDNLGAKYLGIKPVSAVRVSARRI